MDILVIPDTQIVPGCPTNHLRALSHYALERRPDYIVHLGDHWDFHSLSSYDAGKKASESARYQDDIDAGRDALEVFENPIAEYNRTRVFNKKKKYLPIKYFLEGNHDHRLYRYVNDYPVLEGKLSHEDFGLDVWGWDFIPFLSVIDIGGVKFSHYFLNPDSVKRLPFSSSVDTQLKNLGFSFVAGHTPGLWIASPRYFLDGRVVRGVVAGSFYQHDFAYQNPPQGSQYWRGALYLEDTANGNFRLTELPMNWLLKNYE